MLNLAKVVIWAEDQTGPATDSAARNLRNVGSSSEFLEKKLQQLTGLLSLAFMGKLVKDAVEAQAKVKDLAIEAGMTVEQFSRFEEIGRTSGEGLDGIAAAVGKLSKSMVEARDPTSAQAQALKAINLSWKELQGLSPDEQLIRIAKAQAEFAPGLEKNAVMMALFSKGGAKFQVALNEIAEAQKLTSSTTTKQAEEADRLVDELAKLRLQSDLLSRGLLSSVVPALNSILEAFVEGKREAGLYEGAVKALSAAFDAIKGTGPAAQLKLIEDRLKEAIKASETLRDRPWWLSFVDEGPLRGQAAQVEALRKQKEALEKDIHAMELVAQDKRALAGMKKGKPTPDFDPDAARRNAEEQKQYEAASLEIQKQIDLLGEKERLGRDLTTSEKLLVEIEVGKYAKLTPLHKAGLKMQAEFLGGIEQEVLLHASVNKAIADGIVERGKYVTKIREEIDQQAAANDTYGLTKTQIEQVTVARLEEQLAMLRASGAMESDLELLAEEIALRRRLLGEYRRGDILEQLRREKELQAQVFDEAASRGSNFLVDLATHGREAFKSLRQSVNEFGREMLAIFTKRWLLQLGAAMTGNTALSVAAGQAGQGSLAGAALDYVSGGSSASSLVSGGTAAYGAYTGFAAGYGSAGYGMAGTYAYGAASQTGSFMAGEAIGGLGATGWGLIIVAAIAVVSYFASRRAGGPKPGGSFMGSYDSSGEFTGDVSVPGTDNGRFFTPSQGDPAMREFGNSIAGGFFATLHRLGGTTGGIDFGFGFDRDPSGTADNRVSAMVRDSQGNVLYSNTQTAGRDDEDFNRVMALQTRRAILAGLQGSDLPEAIADILNMVAVDTASTDQIDQVLALADAMRTLLDVLTPLSVEDLVAQAGRSAIDAWRAQGAQLQELASSTTLSVESLGRLTEATGQYRAAAAQLILQFEAARQSVEGGISSTIRDMRFQTLDRQGQYDMLRGEASGLAGGLGGMQDASQIVEAVNQIRALSSQAFGMLSDDDRRAMLAEYEAGLQEVQRIADERLVALRTEVETEANAQLARQETAANNMVSAANKMEAAAKSFDAAATRLAEAEIGVRFSGDPYGNSFEVSPA